MRFENFKGAVSSWQLLALVVLVFSCKTITKRPGDIRDKQHDPWVLAVDILKQIHAPVFPDKDFILTDFGAQGNGTTDCTGAFKAAIEACNAQGGGRVVVPRGTYLTGAIHLKSNVNLHLQEGSRINFSTDPDHYLPVVYTRWEGVELMNYSPLVYAYNEENIAITGSGILDGQAGNDNWWPWKGRKNYGWKEGTPHQNLPDNRQRLFQLAEEGVEVKNRVFGKGYYLRPQFIQPYKCENVLIEGVTILNSPMWVLNPVLCRNVTIRGLTINSLGPNSDGCDPESCTNVLIENCTFTTGDDCIAIKSGRNADGRRLNAASENFIIRNCTMSDGHGGIVIGSEISGGVRNIFVENCVMNSPDLQRALRIKTNSMRGGIIENIYLRNIQVGQVSDQVIRINMFYEDSGPFLPVVRNVHVSNMTVEDGGKTGILLEGYEESPIQGVTLKDVTIKKVDQDYKFSNARNVSFENVEINGKNTVLK